MMTAGQRSFRCIVFGLAGCVPAMTAGATQTRETSHSLSSPWDKVTPPSTYAPYACPATIHVAADLELEGFYSDPSYSIIDDQKLKTYQAASRPSSALATVVAEAADEYQASGNVHAARCALAQLEAAAREGSLAGTMRTKQAYYVQGWIAGSLAIDYLKIRAGITVPVDERKSIASWLQGIASQTLAYYVRQEEEGGADASNNHIYWAAMEVAAIAISVGDDALWQWAGKAARKGIRDVAEDGTLPMEMARKRRALHYHLFASSPLVMVAEFRCANGDDLYAERDGALRKLVHRSLEGLVDNTYFTEKTGVDQDAPTGLPTAEEIGWSMPFLQRFPEERLRRLLASTESWSYVFTGGLPPSAQGCGMPARQQIHVSMDVMSPRQMIEGFGVNFNGTYFRLSQKKMVDLLIDDLGATIFRLDPFGQMDWETHESIADPKAVDWAYYNDRYSTPVFEASWAAGRYLNHRGILPLLNLSGRPPAWMLDPKNSAHLSPAKYPQFARTVATLAAYASRHAHVNFAYLGPVNETDCAPKEGPGIETTEMPLVLDAVVERLQEEGLAATRLVVADQCHEEDDFVGPILHDSSLLTHVRAFSFHSYRKESFAADVNRIRGTSPAASVWLTEYGDLNDEDHSLDNEWESFSLSATRRALRALNDGMNAAVYWDAFDNFHEHDQRMTFYGLLTNHDHTFTPKKRYYAAKQLYHWVPVGSQRIDASVDSPNLTISAFTHAGRLIMVGVKQGGPSHISISVSGTATHIRSFRLIQTTKTADCVDLGVIPAHGNTLQLALPNESIFTLVENTGRGRNGNQPSGSCL